MAEGVQGVFGTAISAPTANESTVSSVAAVFLCGVFAFLDLYATQPLLPLLADPFHASKAAVGLTVSASTVGVAVSAPFLGTLTERLSRRRVIVWSIATLVMPTLLAATAPTLQMLVFWRFVQGLIMPGVFAITIAYIGEEWPPESVALVMSVYMSGTSLGGFLGRIISGLAAERMSWHWGFVILGLITLAGSYVVARWLPYERHPRHIDTEPGFASMRRHLRNPRLLATFAVGFNVLFSLVGIFTYITFYLDAPPFRLSTEKLSYLFVVYLIGVIAPRWRGI